MWEVWTLVLAQFAGYIYLDFFVAVLGETTPGGGPSPGGISGKSLRHIFSFLFREGSVQSIHLPNPPPPEFNVGDERHQNCEGPRNKQNLQY